METHHEESIRRTVEHFQNDPEVEALLLGGSLAHRFERPTSDVDVMIVISDQNYSKRLAEGRLAFFSRELCTYPEGYIDGKYVTAEFMQRVAASGSEPARFAFQDARVLLSRMNGLDALVRLIGRYPVEDKVNRIRRFYAQLECWNWYTSEALKLNNRYLLGVSVDKLVLFGGRLILAHNELLYPYHKWFLKVLERAQDKPAGLLGCMDSLLAEPTKEHIAAFFETIKNFRAWEIAETPWPNLFMTDSELNWVHGHTPVDDV